MRRTLHHSGHGFDVALRQLQALIQLASPADAYTNLSRGLAIKMVVATLGEPFKWIDRDDRV